MKHQIEPIGIIHSQYRTKEECPIQGAVTPQGKGRIEIFPEYGEGLKDIDTFSHIILIYIFDRAGDIQLVRPTFLDDTPHGVFASRHPCRPNGIGLSIVKLDSCTDNTIDVSGIDILDRTPLVDLKPYIPRFDQIDGASNGWTENKELRPKPKDRE